MWTTGTPARYYSTTCMRTIQLHVALSEKIESSYLKFSQMPHLQKESTVRFNDKKEIYFLSTIHRANMVNTGRRDREGNQVRKLQVVHDYNRYMGGVDRNDEMLANYISVRKSMKWTKKVAFHFIEEAVLNAYLLNKKSDNRKRYLKFKLVAISALLAAGGTDIAAPAATDRLSGRHFPEVIPPTPMKQNPQKRCVVCTRNKRRKESRYHCGDCPEKPGLSAAPCFKIYHTQANF